MTWSRRWARTSTEYPYVFLDATYCKARVNHRVVSQEVVVAFGVAADGRREVLGFDVGDSENEGFWTAFLRSLKTRGLDGVKLVISDAHTGLKKAIDTVFQGAGLAALPDPLHAKEKPGTACAAESPFPSTSGSKAAPKGDEAGRPRPQ
ncbi:transposase for insertion sequence element IS256 in transposon Tn4001 [Arthrobacter sp. Hiyo8]|nr:transposase for insertion sequence element IS256 in transposon Tn4001 [Arthrobacter sp. Hiyo8]